MDLKNEKCVSYPKCAICGVDGDNDRIPFFDGPAIDMGSLTDSVELKQKLVSKHVITICRGCLLELAKAEKIDNMMNVVRKEINGV